jgi:peptide/nickel transport system substrate-binding protein
MKRRSATPLTAAGATVLLALAACSGSKPSSWDTSGGYNAALNAVANASSHKGGTIIFDYSTVPDSTDPGNTYHAEVWNLLRLYGRALVTYKSAPGAAGMQLVPDLATSLGEVSDNGLTWTYHLKPGIRYESGATVTSRGRPRRCGSRLSIGRGRGDGPRWRAGTPGSR